MNEPAAATAPRRHSLWVKVLAGIALLAVVLALLAAFFPWDVLRGPLNRYVSDKTGRHFEITRKLDVKLGRVTRVIADGIEFANPEWAKDPHLVKAEGAEIQIELLPLLKRHIVMPRIELREPQLGLQIEPDGRRSWALGRDTSDPKNIPDIGALVVDKGTVHYIDSEHGADIRTDFAIDGPLTLPAARRAEAASSQQAAAAAAPNTPAAQTASAEMPLSFDAKGTWQKEPFTAKGRTGNVLYLSAPLQNPFPLEVDAAAGATRLRARGAIASLATLDGADAIFDLQGKNLADLYKLVGVVLPSTPRYALHGHMSKKGEVWQVRDIKGKLGNSDMAGELAFDRAQKVPHLAGKLRSNSLDFDDLAPVVGLPEQPRTAAAKQAAGTDVGPNGKKVKKPRDPNKKVLPTTPLDLARLKAMNSEVTYSAAHVKNAGKMPLDRMAMQVRLKNGVLQLDDVNLGIAGGTVAGKLRIDSHSNPAVAEVHLNGRSLELSKMFRDINLTKTSFGRIHTDIDLKGRGNSVAQMLGGATGNVAMLMGKGQISNLLLEIAGLDGAEIIRFLLRGDANVPVRCAATAFDVTKGLMTSRALVLDTTDTVVYGEGTVNLASESIDLYFRPYPKDASFLSLRSPLRVRGTLGAPDAGPDKSALATRAAAALALGAINPLLALAATIETGPGEDANCGAILRQAAAGHATGAAGAKSPREQRDAATLQKDAAALGGPGAAPKARLGFGGGKPNENTPSTADASASQDPATAGRLNVR
jgi:AsmA family protein